MIISTRTLTVVFVLCVLAAAGTVGLRMYRNSADLVSSTDHLYEIRVRTMVYDGTTWHNTCAIICDTWEAYDQFADDYKNHYAPPCRVIVWPDTPPPEDGLHNFN